MSDNQPIVYIDRQTGERHEETVMGDAAIRWAYLSLSGKIFAPLLFGNSLLSRILGAYFSSGLSRKKIPATIADLGIDPSEFAKRVADFTSFNDFFTRALKPSARPYAETETDFLSPADGRLLVYPNVGDGTRIAIKGVESTLTDLFAEPLPNFHGGDVIVVRLCPADYHRYHFPCSGTVVQSTAIRGAYHSVNPLALAAVPRVFCRNKRALSIIDSPTFGKVAFMEVGAFGVAGIHNTYDGSKVQRMQEKGYFDFGGSTVVLVTEPGRVKLADDLIANSAEGVETLVKVGETIGSADSLSF